MVPLIDEYDNMSRKYENVKQIPSTNSSQLFYIKIMVVVAAALFSIIAIALVVYIYGKRKTRTQEKGTFIALCLIFYMFITLFNIHVQ